jgi:alkyl hydroperoxide reductase subunit AhpF
MAPALVIPGMPTESTEIAGPTAYDVVVVGGGVAGLSAAVFTARAGKETLVLDAGGSILRRNAHLENYPGFPAGVNARLLLDMIEAQADRAGCDRREGDVTAVEATDGGFRVETAAGDAHESEYEVGYLDGIEGVGILDRGKQFVDTDEGGRTGVDGLYAAGRLAEKPHQAIVSAGHGAEVAVALLEDDDDPFYHDWVAPEGYFTDRGRDVPPGCEEIDEATGREREDEARETLREFVADPHPDDQPTHPSLREE